MKRKPDNRISMKFSPETKANFDRAHLNHIYKTGKVITFADFVAYVGKKLVE